MVSSKTVQTSSSCLSIIFEKPEFDSLGDPKRTKTFNSETALSSASTWTSVFSVSQNIMIIVY